MHSVKRSDRSARSRTLLHILLLAVILAPSGGCFWLAVGGAGYTGYEVAKDDRSVGTKLDDATITSSVKAKLVKDDRIDALDINVDTYESVVTLHGHVDTAADVERALQLARSVKGVKSARSDLVVISP